MKKQKEKHILTNQQGFTLAELLVVVAIIGILVAISVPVFAAQLERSREATDMANVRVAYAEVLTAVNSGDVNESRIVPLKQKEDGWQTPRKVMIGGITENDTNNWIGNPTAKGSCKVYYDPAIGPVLQWSRELFPFQYRLECQARNLPIVYYRYSLAFLSPPSLPSPAPSSRRCGRGQTLGSV